MNKKLTAIVLLAIVLSGCVSTHFSVVDENTYRLTKMSDACAAGSPGSVLNHLRSEALQFCAARKEIPEEVSSETQFGIPVIRCASATLVFTCSTKAAK